MDMRRRRECARIWKVSNESDPVERHVLDAGRCSFRTGSSPNEHRVLRTRAKGVHARESSATTPEGHHSRIGLLRAHAFATHSSDRRKKFANSDESGCLMRELCSCIGLMAS